MRIVVRTTGGSLALGVAFLAPIMAALMCFAPGRADAEMKEPREIAGFVLGDDIGEYKDRLRMETALPMWRQEHFGRVLLADLPGYRSGYITFGRCLDKNRILRIKLNYADPSLDFFNRVLKALKERYGEPVEWRGDAFGTLRTWKWDLDEISLILQHYSGDDDNFSQGNSIRLANREAMKRERQCGRDAMQKSGDRSSDSPARPEGLEWFLPK